MKATGRISVLIIALAHVYYTSGAPNKGIITDESNEEYLNTNLENIFENNEENFSIIGGKTARIRDYPYTAAIITRAHHVGSAIIINKKWVLTSAWVVFLENASEILVRAGSSSAINGGQTSWAEKTIIHPKYANSSWLNDLALVKLKKPLHFNKDVKAIKIGNVSPSKGNIPVVTGFGYAKHTGNGHGLYEHNGWLRSTSLKAMPYEDCRKYYGSYQTFTKLSYCTAVTTNEGPCFFDFGSPLVYKKKLVGVFSGTPFCADPDYPPVYTDATKLKKWIYDTIKHHSKMDNELDVLKDVQYYE